MHHRRRLSSLITAIISNPGVLPQLHAYHIAHRDGPRLQLYFLHIYDIKRPNIALNISFPNSRSMSKLVLMCTLFLGPCHISFPVQHDQQNIFWWSIARCNPICDVLFSVRNANKCVVFIRHSAGALGVR